MKSLNMLVSLLFLSLSACASHTVSDFRADITLPASEDCYGFHVVSGKEVRLPAESKECQEQKIKSVRLDYENYKILRTDIQKNCLVSKCKEITGYFDELFLRIDQGLRKIQ